MRRIFVLILIPIFMLTIFSCAHLMRYSKNEDELVTAKELLENIFNSYKNYKRLEFSKLISNEFIPNKEDFLDGLEKNFYGKNILEINYFIENVLRNRDVLAVVFKWEKKFSSFDNNELILLKGKTEFVFKKKDKIWLLYQVRGDKLF